MLQRCAEAVQKHLGVAFTRIWTLCPTEPVLELQASAGLYTHLDGPHGRVPVGKFKIGLIALERAPHLTNEVQTDPRVGDKAWAKREGMVAFAGYPLLIGSRVVGVLALFARERLDPDVLSVLGLVADTIALGVHRLRTEQDRILLIAALKKSNQDLDQFAYVASHDLKAPLRGIANLSEWLEEDLGAAVTPTAAEQLRLLRGRVHRLEALIDGILDYSRAGRDRHQAERVAVGPLVREVVELLDPPAGIQVEVEGAMPELETERTPLQQVFMNLVGNAIKHTHREDARVQISVRHQDGFYDFSVSDNGPGIAPEFHQKVWGIFQTLEARDQVEGTGIGLAVVKKVVESRGGRAWLESKPGAGATFHFTWPQQDGASKATHPDG